MATKKLHFISEMLSLEGNRQIFSEIFGNIKYSCQFCQKNKAIMIYNLKTDIKRKKSKNAFWTFCKQGNPLKQEKRALFVLFFENDKK